MADADQGQEQGQTFLFTKRSLQTKPNQTRHTIPVPWERSLTQKSHKVESSDQWNSVAETEHCASSIPTLRLLSKITHWGHQRYIPNTGRLLYVTAFRHYVILPSLAASTLQHSTGIIAIVKNKWMLTSIYTTRLKGVISYSPLELATTFNVASHLNVTMIRNLFNKVFFKLMVPCNMIQC